MVLNQNISLLNNIIMENYRLNSDYINNFIKYTKKEKSNSRKWFELIYCILAGTQIKTTIVQKTFNNLIDNYYDMLRLENITESPLNLIYISNCLRNSGYRFHKTKALVILNAAEFFKKENNDINNFLKKYDEYHKIRNELIQIKGIGRKIISHWLRNIGFDIPIIDIHIKNLLIRFKIIQKPLRNYLEYEKLLIELAGILNRNLIFVDLNLWQFGKDFCGNKNCKNCPFKRTCTQ
ncbi:MAG: 8-oxoguanine DNA glycosylase [Candidatus Helarchaeota archaeon]